MERESIDFDVLFVGGGPACLAGAIRLMQMAQSQGLELEVALIEKGAEIGAHALSGAVINPRALAELLPDYREQGCPIEQTVSGDAFYFMTADRAWRMPLVPRDMHNQGCHIISLSRFTRWLAEKAEAMGVNIFSGFAGSEVLYDELGQGVVGVRTGDKGIGKDGQRKPNFEPGIDLLAKVTVFGEGPRGSLMKRMEGKLGLAQGKGPQVYETGIKEVIQLPEDNYFNHSDANDIHTLGYPLDMHTPGGGFIYQMKDNRIALGYLVGLCYEKPMLDPEAIFFQFKRHPLVSEIIKGGKVLERGAKTVSTGGYYSMPKLAVDGGLFVGAAAAMHNSPALKGVHLAMKSGMLAAEAIMHAFDKQIFGASTLQRYKGLIDSSWIHAELYQGRNFAQALAKKSPIKFVHLGVQYFTKGKGLRDPMPLHDDATTLKSAKGADPLPEPLIDAQAYDDELFIDKLTGVYLSKTIHNEDQPSHLQVHDTELCFRECYPKFRSPCTRFCPAKVYEIETDEQTGRRRLKLNPSNCFHCKTCDVKDPYHNITWTCPEGGDGPGFQQM
jgi:electron-transferring-flavoprotein dehydrogenase